MAAASPQRSVPVGDIGLVLSERKARVLGGSPSPAGPVPDVTPVVPSVALPPPQMKEPAPVSAVVRVDPGLSPVSGRGVPVKVDGDNDKGAAVSYTAEPPTFCGGSTEDEINRAFKGDPGAYVYDLDRHKGAKNPKQCEEARLMDLALGKHYRESPGELLKNFGAGVLNGIIPGSDLGDAQSSTQVLGQLVGGAASLGVGGASGIVSSLTKGSNMSALGNLISKANTFLASPLGQIGHQALLSALPKGTQPMVSQPGVQMGVSPIVPDATFLPGWGIRSTGSTKSPDIAPPVNAPAGTSTKKGFEFPSWGYAVIGGAVLLFLLGKKRGRRG